MMTIYAIYLKAWNMPEAQPQEYFTSMRKAQNRLDEIDRSMSRVVYKITRVSKTRVEGVAYFGNKSPRIFEIKAVEVQ